MRSAAVLLASALLLVGCSSSSNKQSTVAARPSTVAATAAATRIPVAPSPTAATATAAAASPSPPRAGTPASATASALPNEEALAKSMLLTLDAFPLGWTETPSSSNTSLLDKCQPGEPPGQTARAETGNFSRGGAASISETIVLFDTPEHVSGALDTLEPALTCAIKIIADGGLDDASYAFSMPSLSSLAFPKLGDRTSAFRIRFHVKAKGQTGPDSEGDAYLDTAYLQVGRIGLSVMGTNILAPYDMNDLVQKATAALAKAQQKLPAR